jgi:peptidoglycan/xylan/chitin deacetylase (PgdA/CDA1 family)
MVLSRFKEVTDMTSPARDFVGYGRGVPRVRWPNDARVALTFAVNYEAGGERSFLYGESPETYGEFPVYGSPPPQRDLAIESIFEYETRVAIWRVLDLFKKHKIKVTFFATARTLEVNEEATNEIVKDGHEICSHGYRWIESFTLSRQVEREQIKKAVTTIERLTGQRPLGWYCREPSENTIELLVEEGGFLYDSDAYNDDLPYYARAGSKSLLVIPYTPDVNDFHFLSNRFSNSEQFFRYMIDSFDTLYNEGAQNPKLMNVGIHVRISGRPGRIAALDSFLNYLKKKPEVWIARRVDIAKWWLSNYKPPT